MKYVMFQGDNFVIIPNSMNHSDVVETGTPVSAGFCSIGIEEGYFGESRYKVTCWGKSHSLGLESRKEDGLIMSCSL